MNLLRYFLLQTQAYFMPLGFVSLGKKQTDLNITAAGLGINTDAINAHTALEQLPDLQQLMAEQAAERTAIGTISQATSLVAADVIGRASNNANAEEKAAQEALDNAKASGDPYQISTAQGNLEQASNNAAHWSSDGRYAIATNAVNTVVIGLASGQSPQAIAALIASPVIANAIGEKIGSDNTAGKFAAHAIAAGIIAALGGADTKEAIAAGLATGLVESIIAPTLVKQLYGDVNPNTLTDGQKATVLALSGIAGAITAGLVADSSGAAAYGAAGSLNAVANNYLTAHQLIDVEKAYQDCNSKKDVDLCRSVVKTNANALSASQDISLSLAKAKCLVGFCDELNAIKKGQEDSMYYPGVVNHIKSAHPDWPNDYVYQKADEYIAEQKASTSASGSRTVIGTLDAVSVIPAGATASALGKIGLTTTKNSVKNKLQTYLLNSAHPAGASKAKWFESALGYTKSNADGLAKQIVFSEASAVKTGVTQYGIKYNQVIPITGANGRTINVTFGWIRNNDGVPRLVTAIPKAR